MKQIIRLTESDLHRLVKESVKSILKESGKGLGYGLPDAEKKALRTKMGGFKPGEEWSEIEVDYGSGPFKKSYKEKISPEQVRQNAHKKARGKGKPLARSQKYVKHSKMADEGEYDHNDYDEYVENYLCDKYNGTPVYNSAFGEYIAVPVEDRWQGTWDMVQDFKKYGYGWYETMPFRSIEYDLEDEFDPDMDYMAFVKGKSSAYNEGGRNPNTGRIDFTPQSSKLGKTPKIGTSEFMKQNGQQ